MRHQTLAAALLVLLAATAVAGQSTQQPTPTPIPPPVPKSSPTPSPSPAAQPQSQTQPASDAKRKYDALLEAAKKDGASVDYKALRLAYFETPDYSPLTGMMNYRALWGLLMQQNWAEAAKQAEVVLARNHVDINAHMVAHIAYRQQANDEKAKYHRRWAEGLLESVKAGGDGKSPDTAWEVIAISEEYALLRSMNLERVQQSVMHDKGHAYDMMRVVDPRTKAETTFFFNVDKPFSAYLRK
ncbi:MAG TPA: DUF4919 domain-containing protein [Pyrinomonadaceae bacterium]|jgi:hypothetical protein|nr:DUF4919 domain-containing protein [Pyrinomonadaceae bacterium]